MSEPGLMLGKDSVVGTGDRFAHQAKAQLQACILAEKKGIIANPVWNKSNREHISSSALGPHLYAGRPTPR